MGKYSFVVDRGVKEVWDEGVLVKQWKGNPLPSDIALYIYEQGWHMSIGVSDDVWKDYLTKEIGQIIKRNDK